MNDKKFNYKSLFNSINIRNIIKAFSIVFLCSIIGLLLLLIVFALPVNRIDRNVANSAEFLKSEGMYKHIAKWCSSRLDNQTDTLMLSESAFDSDDSLLNKVLFVYRGKIGKKPNYYVLLDHYIQGIEYDGVAAYPRYWHGYLLYVKPLLILFNYQTIRIINGIVQLLLNLGIIYYLNKKGLRKYIIPYILSFLMMMPVAMACSLQFSSCFYVYSFFTILLLRNNDNKDPWIFFLLSGVLTAYIDFLTYPIATIGIPLIIYILLNKDSDSEELLSNIIRYCFYWAFGYGLMWFNKWLFASVLTNENILLDGFNSLIFRLSGAVKDDNIKIGVIEVVLQNFIKFFYTPVTILVILYAIYKLICMENINRSSFLYRSIPYIFVSLLPVMWYIVVPNHSYIHAYYSGKGLIVLVFGLLCLLTRLDDYEKY